MSFFHLVIKYTYIYILSHEKSISQMGVTKLYSSPFLLYTLFHFIPLVFQKT